jgi:hypothetical protein
MSDMLQQGVGDRGIGVQFKGDGNTVVVYAGRSELHLARKHARNAAAVATELELLRVDLRATTLVGRKSEVASLQDWLSDSRPVLVRCMIGRAGTGKTRLGIELCEYAECSGWTAGFAQYGQFTEFVKQVAGLRWDKPILIVVDYAASLVRELRVWLEALAQREPVQEEKRLRILLLERHAERDFGWWAELIRFASLSAPSPDQFADPPEPVPLQSLSRLEDRHDLLAETMRLAGEMARMPSTPTPPRPGTDSGFEQRLADARINNEPLYLMMAAVVAVQTGAPAALALSRIDLAERLAQREWERLNHLAAGWGLPEELVSHLAMCVNLQDGCSADQSLHLIEEERQAMDFAAIVPSASVVKRLTEALPAASGTAVDAIRPDLIGEAFLLQVMHEHRLFPKTQAAIVERAFRRVGTKVFRVLVRTAQDHASGEPGHPSVGWIGHLIQCANNSDLIALAPELPESTLALREIATSATERIVATLRNTDAVLLPDYASGLNNLAIRLGKLGRYEAALEKAEEALTIYRELAARHPDAYRQHLAPSLNTVANALNSTGQPKEGAPNGAGGYGAMPRTGGERPRCVPIPSRRLAQYSRERTRRNATV